MKVASLVWEKEIASETKARKHLELALAEAQKQEVELIVFPALVGAVLGVSDYESLIHEWSQQYPDLYICPGSYYLTRNDEFFHCSCLIKNGEVLLRQDQLYLAKWEQRLGLSRGKELSFTQIDNYRVALIISTDVFYPQVFRFAALSGANLILSPVAITGAPSCAAQLKGVWQNTQANTLFAVESGFKGIYKGKGFTSKSFIHAPIGSTRQEEPYLATETQGQVLVTAVLDPKMLSEAKNDFDPLAQLNPKAFTQLYTEVSLK